MEDRFLNTLLSSGARAKILALLFTHPAERVYLRQMAARSNLPVQAVQREVKKLASLGILSASREGNRIYFSLNRSHFLFDEMKRIVLKTAGLAETLREALRSAPGIAVAFLYGSTVGGQERPSSDVDLCVVADVSPQDVTTALAQAKEFLGREINVSVYPPKEFKEKFGKGHHFVSELVRCEKIFLKGSENDLKRITARR